MAAHGDAAESDYSDWMKNLPKSLHTVPLNHLAIPGNKLLICSHLAVWLIMHYCTAVRPSL